MRQLAAALAVLGVMLLGAAGASGNATPKCFGERATIVGSGLIDGTEGVDVIVGSDGPDTINAFGGNDLVCGLGDVDSFRGGLGHDRLDGGEGNDRLIGDVFVDLFSGSERPAGDE
jgi:Ca2+-binding RTX toxin-like protein